jgi:outer membrane protein assembly factor BamE (lipoprotein component of BamABCDE complex)
LNKVDKIHGVINLKNKVKSLTIEKSNKNDVKKIIGPSIINDKNKWTYVEVRETVTKFGKNKIYLSDYAEIYFDNYSIVKQINFYDLKKQKEIKFSKDGTKIYAIEDSFVKNLLSSTRERARRARERVK